MKYQGVNRDVNRVTELKLGLKKWIWPEEEAILEESTNTGDDSPQQTHKRTKRNKRKKNQNDK